MEKRIVDEYMKVESRISSQLFHVTFNHLDEAMKVTDISLKGLQNRE